MSRTLAQWRTVIEQQQTSGLDVKAWCQQQNINPKTFYNRRVKLGLSTAKKAPQFVKAAPVKPLSQSISLQIGEARLTIPVSASPQWVAELLKAMV